MDTKLKRIIKELDEAIENEKMDNNNIITNKVAQQRIVNIWKEAKSNFDIPKFTTEFDLTKWHLKRKKRK